MAKATLVGSIRNGRETKSFQLTPYATLRLDLAQKQRSLLTKSAIIQNKRLSKSTTIFYSTDECSYGPILVARTEKGICALLIGSETNLQQDLMKRFPKSQIRKVQDERSRVEMKRICRFLEFPSDATLIPDDDLALDLQGSEFQLCVWKALLEIPVGTTETYSQLAQRAKLPTSSSRAVANACGQNHIAFLVPCHRIQRSDGQLGGYHWGIDMKKKMLQSERKKSSIFKT